MWPKSPLFKLNPVFDEDGGICSNGRLQFAEYLPYGVRFPKIMLRGHWVTKLIIKHYYEQANHSAGTKFLLQHVQTKEEQVINTDHDSICFPRSTWGSLSIPLTKQQWTMLGLLPRYREDLHHKKRWLCLLTIAVHLEIAFGLDTDSFPNAFTGKTSRRGVPKEMIGNCGTNFVGAVSELKELISKLDQKKIQQDTTYQAVKWNFKTASNHWGANYCCCWIESLLNSQALTYQPADPRDVAPLAANHFLHGQLGGQFAPETVDTTKFRPRKWWRNLFIKASLVEKVAGLFVSSWG